MDFSNEEIRDSIITVCDELKDLLLRKNRSYGSSFADPVRIFAKGLPADVQILVRIDDKLSRLMRGTDEMDENTTIDLIGYLILWHVLQELNKPKVQKPSKRTGVRSDKKTLQGLLPGMVAKKSEALREEARTSRKVRKRKIPFKTVK